MERITVNYVGGRMFNASMRGHTVSLDLPREQQGTDTGPTPPELFVASLASCMGYYLLFYCDRARLDPAGLTVEAEFQKLPDRIGTILIRINLPSATTAAQKEEADAWAHKCFIHNTLTHTPAITVEIV